MPCHTPKVYATIAGQQTGEFIRRLGPYATASAARVACGEAAGEALLWIRGEGQWEAEQEGALYRVPADSE